MDFIRRWKRAETTNLGMAFGRKGAEVVRQKESTELTEFSRFFLEKG